MRILRMKVCGLLQKAMSELFGVDKSGISRHLKNIFSTGELDEKVVVAKIAMGQRTTAVTKSAFPPAPFI